MSFSNSIEELKSTIPDYNKSEEEVLTLIQNCNYPQNHPFLEYPNTPSGVSLVYIILLKCITKDDGLILDFIKKCKATENGVYKYDRFRQGINEVLFLFYLVVGLSNNFHNDSKYKINSPHNRTIDNDNLLEYSISLDYNSKKYTINVEVKTLSCEALPNEGIKDGQQIIIPYNDTPDFIDNLSQRFPSARILKEKCFLIPLLRNICKIKNKFDGKNLTNTTLFNIGVIFIDRSASIEQFHSYLFNQDFGILPRTDTGNIDLLVLLSLDAKNDLLLSNIYNMGYVQTILFNDSDEYTDICTMLRLNNFAMIGKEIMPNVIENAKKEFDNVKIMCRDGFINLIPYDTTEEEISKYLRFLKGDSPRLSS